MVQTAPALPQVTSSENPANPTSNSLDQLQRYGREDNGRQKKEQVTSVSQLSDVQPTDWAFQALQSLVERYGCIAGYPDGTYKGNRALTRYEFAAGVNACLERINELISASTTNLVTREDLAKLQRLMEEFAAELASLRGRVTVLEARASELEANQFSTTTKLVGQVIFGLADVFGADDEDFNTVLQYRADINLITSFTGQDLLITGIKTGNATAPGLGGSRFGLSLPGTEVGLPLGNSFTVPSAEATLASQYGAVFDNELNLTTLEYQFPVTSRLRAYIGLGSEVHNQIAPTLNPYFDDADGGTGAITAFGQRNPIYRLGGGGPGIGFNYVLTPDLTLTGTYLTSTINGAFDPVNGFFAGTYSALGQITWKPSPAFGIGATYTNSYFAPGRFGYNNFGLALTGTAVANTLAGQTLLGGDILLDRGAVIANSYGVQAFFQPSPYFVITGWFAATYARLIGDGDGEILTYALNFGFPDLGKEGNFLGVVVGAEPYLTRYEDGNPSDFEVDIPLHIEAYYRFQFTPNISLTPGIVWLTAPNQDNSNGDDFVGVLRGTFQF
ncbi:MAG: iron uptake porin [Oscillatoriales cyanobacterium SM2_3_0]|nr:iron uptake porin [Oscillatoriales cyanobacterium SM2_3_0]